MPREKKPLGKLPHFRKLTPIKLHPIAQTQKIELRKITSITPTPRKIAPAMFPPPPAKKFVVVDIILQLSLLLFFLTLIPAASIMDLLVTLVNDVLPLTVVTKNSILDVAGDVDSSLSILGKLSPRWLSVRYIGQLATHGQTVTIAKSALCKIFAHKHIISNE